ncbi:MAG TPA: CidA/LrgA family protein [Longimicrobiaceae bacterium]|nr:CidA/LrgA family protein [Longimicrobiaceae bacterium]
MSGDGPGGREGSTDASAPTAAAPEAEGMEPAGVLSPRAAWWRYATSALVLLAFLLAGSSVASFGRLPLPGSVVGMLLLAAALHFRWMPIAWVEPAAELLLRHMALLFVPPGVGLMLQYDLLRREWLPIVAASAASTLAVLLVVGRLQQRLEARG